MGPNRAILSANEGDGKIVETTSFGRRSAHRGTILQGTEGTPLALEAVADLFPARSGGDRSGQSAEE
jgi:hypothetical protein